MSDVLMLMLTLTLTLTLTWDVCLCQQIILGQPLQHVRPIILEADMGTKNPHCQSQCVDYDLWGWRLQAVGFKLLVRIPDEMYPAIEHLVFSRHRSAAAAAAAVVHMHQPLGSLTHGGAPQGGAAAAKVRGDRDWASRAGACRTACYRKG